MNDMENLEKALCEPFDESELEYRIQQSGVKNGRVWARVFTYVANRAIMNRLDAVFGVGGWQNRFEVVNGGILCGIGAKLPGIDEWVWKWDGAQETDFEPFKGGVSGAMKRAAVHWGIGRYLYNLEATWATVTEDGRYSDKVKGDDGKTIWFKWNPPPMPDWALPGGSGVPQNGRNALPGAQKSTQKPLGGPGYGQANSSPVAGQNGPVTVTMMDEAWGRAVGAGLTSGQFKALFAALTGKVGKNGKVEYERLTKEEYDAVWDALHSKETYNAALAKASSAQEAEIF
jgi:hypothetical protein